MNYSAVYLKMRPKFGKVQIKFTIQRRFSARVHMDCFNLFYVFKKTVFDKIIQVCNHDTTHHVIRSITQCDTKKTGCKKRKPQRYFNFIKLKEKIQLRRKNEKN